MTLDEAIKHAEEVAEEKDMQAGFDTNYLCYQMSEAERNQCKECAKEHRQLAGWLKELKQLREQQSCEDAVSRKEVLNQTYLWSKDEFLRVTNPFDYLRKRISSLTPVTSQPKMGHWIRWYEKKENDGYTENIPHCKCSECGKEYDPYSSQFIKYCNECGAKMQEVEE